MTRDMLIKLLCDEHRLQTFGGGDFDEIPEYFCYCSDTELDNYDEWAEHVADLILLGFAS